MGKKPIGGLVSKLGLVVLGVAAGAAVGEVVLRSTGYFPFYRWDYHDCLVELDPDLLYRFKGGSRHDLNSLGYRDYEFRRARDGRYRILVLGDSLMFGDNVDVSETVPKILERNLGSSFEVFNMGIIGYGPDQSYAQLLKEGLQFRPDAVILSIFPANDFGDLLRNELIAPDGDGRIKLLRSNPATKAIPLLRIKALIRSVRTGSGLEPSVAEALNHRFTSDPYDTMVDLDSPLTRRKARLMGGLLRMFKETLEVRGIDFFVVIIPSLEIIQNGSNLRKWRTPREAYFNSQNLVESLCEKEGLIFFNLDKPFLAHRRNGLYTPGDGHLSAVGTRLAAHWLSEMVWHNSSGPLPPPSHRHAGKPRSGQSRSKS